MAKIQAVWALDVGQAALKALKLVPGETDGKVVAEAFDYVEYPKILSQPDADADQLVREALATFLERNDVKGCKVAIAVPGQAGLVKFIKLPPVEKKRIPDIVKFEARQQIPFALEEVIWDYQQIGGDDKESADDDDFSMAEVGLFAMKRDQINRAILPFAVAGIEVDLVQMGPIALYNYVTYDRMKNGEKGSVVLLDIGADNTDLIISDGTRVWQRNVPIGGNHFTRALTKELKLTFAKGEHLKRNATKAPDPRAVFTAMRSVFNDLASEINRSIGFYSSVNRSAKILKVVGLGNGFKLPGLQKFLQQNLSHEVEKLDGFSRLTGDDVVSAPQFQENLPSFAVAYGLALQGLGQSQLRTNLLPPEVEQVRMIRRKKPWALAASALLLIGFSALFVGDWKLWAKVTNPRLQDAVKQAKDVTSRGASFESEYEQAKSAWSSSKAVGDALVVDNTEQSRWPAFLKTLNQYLPNPVRDYNLDPNEPKDQPVLDRLRVHIDAIKPVWRNELGPEWFDTLPELTTGVMHPLDRKTPPTGPGWVVQLVGHHYNPDYVAGGDRQVDMGPLPFLLKAILPRFWDPGLRRYGVSHATISYFVIDKAWTSAKEASSNGLASNVPMLARAEPPSSAGGLSSGFGGGPSSGGGATASDRELYGSSGSSGQSILREMMASRASGRMSDAFGGMPGFGVGSPDDKKKMTMLTRTDFVIQLVWKPLAANETPRDIKEIQAELEKADEEKGSIKATNVSEADLERLSKQASERARQALEKAIKGVGPGEAPAGAVAPGVGGLPASASPTPPAPSSSPVAPVPKN
jgi:type IV pilus assembly protein PilM